MAGSARIDELKKKFDENPGRYFAPLANEYRKAGEIDQAITICRTYLAEKPGHMSGLIVFGQALYEAGQFEEARTTFEQALALDPENLIALRHLGDIARDVGDPAVARSWYQRVLEADPRNEEIAAQLAAVTQAAAAAPAPVATPVQSSGMSGWGDINPEKATAEPEAGGTVIIEAVPVRPSPIVEPSRPSLQLLAIDEPPAPEIQRDAPTLEFDATSFGGFDTPPTVSEALGIEHAQEFEMDSARRGIGGLELDQPFDTSLEIAAPSTSDLGLEPTEFAPPSPDDAAGAADMRVSLAFEPSDDLMAAMEMGRSADTSSLRGAEPQRETVSDREFPELGPVAEAEFPEREQVAERALPELEPVSEPEAAVHAEAVDASTFEEPERGGSPAGFVTETMAELYLAQGYRTEALAVYRQLVEQNPGDESLRDKLRKAEQGEAPTEPASSTASSPTHPASTQAEAPARASRSGRSARSFFGALASRRAPQRESDAYLRPHIFENPAASAAIGADISGPSDWVMESEPSRPEPASPASTSPVSAEVFGSSEDDWPEPSATASSAPADTGWGIAPVTAPTPASGNQAAIGDEDPEPARHDEPSTASFEDTKSAPATSDRDADSEQAPGMSGSLDSLFAGAAVPAADDTAASLLAGAFAPPDSSALPSPPARTTPTPPSQRGQPTRAASSELSLDHVFRDSPRKSGAVRQTGGFSFDQFFSDSAMANSTPPAGSEDSTPAAGNATTEDEVLQFTSWLEGLKKK